MNLEKKAENRYKEWYRTLEFDHNPIRRVKSIRALKPKSYMT